MSQSVDFESPHPSIVPDMARAKSASESEPQIAILLEGIQSAESCVILKTHSKITEPQNIQLRNPDVSSITVPAALFPKQELYCFFVKSSG